MADDRDPNVLEQIVDVMGARLDRVSLGVLSDHVDREPVIPADLHLVKAAKPDADGNVTCMFCGTAVPYASAEMIDSAGMACATCKPREVALPATTKLQRRLWPWLVGVPVVCVAVVYGIWHHERAMDRAEYEHQYPAANSPADDAAIEKAFARWRVDDVIAGVGTPPALATLHLGAACDTTIERAMEFRAGEVAELKNTLAYLFQDAKRGRYYDEMARSRTVAQLAGPILVVAIAESEAPEMIGSGSNLEYNGGYRTGAAYLFDIDGTVRCAGSFEAESSEVVKYTTWKSSDPRINGDTKYDATRAVAGDLDDKMHAAIAAGLHRVER
jgi:hypothetical protein